MNTEFKRLGQQPKETMRNVKVSDLEEQVNWTVENRKQIDEELDEALNSYSRKSNNWLDIPLIKKLAEKNNRKWIGSVNDDVKYYKDTPSMGVKVFTEYYSRTSTKSLKYKTVAWVHYAPTSVDGEFQNYNGTVRTVKVGDFVQLVTPLTVIENKL